MVLEIGVREDGGTECLTKPELSSPNPMTDSEILLKTLAHHERTQFINALITSSALLVFVAGRLYRLLKSKGESER
jgi:hypothetical protein